MLSIVKRRGAIGYGLMAARYVMAQAFLLLDDWDEDSLTDDPAWIESTRYKVNEAVKSLAENGGTDGATVVSQLLDKFRQVRESR
jgi:antitoxin ParD1/3/4